MQKMVKMFGIVILFISVFNNQLLAESKKRLTQSQLVNVIDKLDKSIKEKDIEAIIPLFSKHFTSSELVNGKLEKVITSHEEFNEFITKIVKLEDYNSKRIIKSIKIEKNGKVGIVVSVVDESFILNGILKSGRSKELFQFILVDGIPKISSIVYELSNLNKQSET